MLTALPLPGLAGARDVDHFLTFEQASHERVDSTPGRLGNPSHGPVRHGDQGPRNAAHDRRPSGSHGVYLIGPTPTISFSALIVTPLPGLQYQLALLPSTAVPHVSPPTQKSSLDLAVTPTFDAGLVTPPESGIHATASTAPGLAPTPSLSPDTTPTRRTTLLPEGEGMSTTATESFLATTGSLVAASTSLPAAEAVPAVSNSIAPDTADSERHLDDVTKSGTPSPAVMSGKLDAIDSYRAYASSLFELTSASALDAIALSYIESSSGAWSEMLPADFAYAADAWHAATQSSSNSSTEPGLSGDERFTDIAELWDERLEFESRLDRGSDEDGSEPDDTRRTTAEPDLPDPHGWSAFFQRCELLEAIGRQSPQTSAEADQEPAAGEDAGDRGMIEIAYRDPAPPQEPASEVPPTDGDAAEAAGHASIVIIKTDGSCARYQAFEFASQPTRPAPQNEKVAADAASSSSGTKEKTASKDTSA
jgi:hypothetical protein